MRTLLLALMLLALSPEGNACSCFPPEVRAKTARDTLALARLAVYGRVVEISTDGKAKILVLESFKGPGVDTIVDARPAADSCDSTPFVLKEEVLIIAFDEAVTGCDKHPAEHYLLEEFRINAAKGK